MVRYAHIYYMVLVNQIDFYIFFPSGGGEKAYTLHALLSILIIFGCRMRKDNTAQFTRSGEHISFILVFVCSKILGRGPVQVVVMQKLSSGKKTHAPLCCFFLVVYM